MRFRTLIPVFAVVLAIALGACGGGAEEAETELTPADTEMMAPEMAPEMAPMDTMMMDTLHQM